ncbi:hypothetical protein Tco_1271063 [Tanacetum coccineum]
MENPEQAFVDFASSRTDETGSRQFTMNQGPRSFNEAANAWKRKPNFNWAYTQTFTSPWNGSFSTHSSNYQTKLEKALIDFDPHQEKRLSSLRTQLGNSKTTILEDEAKEEGNVKSSTTEYKDHEMTVESKEEFEEETEEEIEEKEEDSPKHFDTFPTMKELRYHEWLLKNPRPLWVKAKIRTGNLNKVKFSCMIGHFDKKQAYLDMESPINVMSRLHYIWIMSKRLEPRMKPSNPKKICNFMGRVKGLKVFVENFTYKCDSWCLRIPLVS